VTIRGIIKHKRFRPVAGAVGTVLCGLLLWSSPPGDAWVRSSYDYLFRFGSHEVTNEVVVVLMDGAARQELGVDPGAIWPRELHARLLNKLADEACPLVVLDVVFPAGRNPESDAALERAMRRQRNLVLAAEQESAMHPGMDSVQVGLPWTPFLQAAGSNHWGVAWLTPDEGDEIVRRHWPFPAPGSDPSLPWTAARLVGAQLPTVPQRQWLRYYGRDGAWTRLSYHFALEKPEGFFENKIVFIGNAPSTRSPADQERDEFRTPYTRWTGESTGGVEILATQFLNLVNGDWLRRPHWSVELVALLFFGILSGAGLYYLRPWMGAITVLAAMLLVAMAAIFLFHFANVWVPWLVIAAGQLPVAWLCAFPRRPQAAVVEAEPGETVIMDLPDTPDYTRVRKLGEGGFGEVWLVQSAIGQWQALKVVYRDKFREERHYHFEFEGIEKYKPVSEKHPGLLRVELISRKRPEGYYFYVMELGDSLVPGWETAPGLYQADNLASRCHLSPQHRLIVREVIRIGIVLAEALHCLHESGLTHRDVKPQNVIFVNGQPKLADVGLVTHARTGETMTTQVGTPGYMPPDSEPQGTLQADIYALGMVLYVISTGKPPSVFPELSKTLLERSDTADFLRMNPVILKACHPDRAERFSTAAQLRDALREALEALESPKA